MAPLFIWDTNVKGHLALNATYSITKQGNSLVKFETSFTSENYIDN